MSGEFPRDYLPYGEFSESDGRRRIGAALDDAIVDLGALAGSAGLDPTLQGGSLNPFLAAGANVWHQTRERLQALVANGDVKRYLVPRAGAQLHLPIEIGDYVDFYSSIEHASNVGKILRPGGEPLTPNYRHMPIGYHGRSSTVSIAGAVRRPCGQTKDPAAEMPAFGPSRQLDFELELGFVIGSSNADGRPIPADEAGKYLFGVVLLNDWSARDVQSWEGQPLGPLLSKSFATTISPWIVPLAALAARRVPNRAQEPPPLAHLRVRDAWALDLELTVSLQTQAMQRNGTAPFQITRVNFRNMYWNAAQQLAHLTSNGTIVRAGDLHGSGTVSGTEPGTYGSLLEATLRGARPLALPDGEARTFLEDGDTVIMRGDGLGEVRATVLPALV